jgi:signal transduction histidine kinase
MRDFIVLFFSLISFLLTGVLVSSLAYIRAEKPMSMEMRLWLSSIFLAISGIAIFAYGTATTPEAIKSNSFAFTIANTLYFGGLVFQALFCRSLASSVSKRLVFFCIFGIAIFAIHFEYLRGSGNFAGRVIEVAILSCLLLAIQSVQLCGILRHRISEQLKYLLFFTILEFILVIVRVVVAAKQVNPVLNINEVPFLMLAVMVAGLTVNALSYLTMVGFWSERIISKRKILELENAQVSALLQERESLIGSLMQANKSATAGALSASLAHEINQPISAIRVNLFTLRRYLSNQAENSENIERLLAHMESDNQRAGDIVGTLRSIFNRDNLNFERISLEKLVNSTIGLIRGELTMHSITLHVHVPSEIHVNVSRIELQQVLLNLLVNAVDALNAFDRCDKSIWITAANDSLGHVQLTVQDNGPGISAEFAKIMFDLFATQKKTGMGVGLWLSQHIVVRWGGEIRYEPREGGGSTFIAQINAV